MHSDEEWRLLPSDNRLLVSSFGRICKVPHFARGRWHNPQPTYGYITKSSKKSQHVYKGIYYKGIGNVKIHRAVCEAFHGIAPADKPYVLHKDENGINNYADNLEWGDQKTNLNMPKFVEYCKSRLGENSPVNKGKFNRMNNT